jgi:flagella basal body P-ring formation protein FlgA
MSPRPFIGLCLALLVSVPASPDAVEDLDRIRAVARDFLARQSGASDPSAIEIGTLDPRLRLAACDTPLQVFLPPGSSVFGRTVVGVRCTAARSWSLYVPAEVRIPGGVIVAARPLARGETLGADDIITRQVDLARTAGGYLTEPQQVIGRVLKYPVGAGVVLSPTMLAAPTLIRRGQAVTLLAQDQGLEVRMAGEAMASGALGETIPVRNLSSRQIVQGTVLSAGLVKAGP